MSSLPLVFVSGEYPPDVGGVGDYTANLRAALAQQDWPSRVVSRQQVRRWDARCLLYLLRTVPREGLIHLQYQAAAFDLLGDICLLPWLLRRARPRLRVLTTFHDARAPYLFPKAGRRLRQAAVRLLADASHAVVAADERDLRQLGGPSARHHLVPIGANVACQPPPGYNRDAFRAELGLEPGSLVLVYFGLINASKGLATLLDAFRQLLETQPDAHLLLVGSTVGASDPTNQATARALNSRLSSLGSRVLRTGHLAGTALSASLLVADLAVLPYADGASPRRGSLLACAAHGLPIVSTTPATGPVADAVLAVPANDPTALADAILRVHRDPHLMARLRQSSTALHSTTTWPQIAAAHARIYAHLP